MTNKPELTDGPLNLDTAIVHAEERATTLSGPCAAQHAQLATWLRELQERRRADSSEPVLYAMQGVKLDTDAVSTCKNVVDGWVDEWNQERKPGMAEYKTVPLYAAQPAPVISSYRDGINAAAKWVDQQRESYDNEYGRRDDDTGSFEFGNDAQREYSDTLAEIAEGIRALHPNVDTSPAPVMVAECEICGKGCTNANHPMKAVAVESPLTVSERAELHAFRRAACNHGFPPGAHTQGVVGCEKCCGRRVMIWELGGDRDHTHQIPGLKQEEITPGMALHLGVNPTKLAKIRDTAAAQLVWQLVIDEGGEISWELDDGTRMILKAEKVASAVANAGGES